MEPTLWAATFDDKLYAQAKAALAAARRDTGIEAKRRFPRFVGRRHSAKKARRLPYRARSPGSIDFPPPWIRGRSPVLHDDGIIFPRNRINLQLR
jgi:hypothetical protein